jgi:hypothetical protein
VACDFRAVFLRASSDIVLVHDGLGGFGAAPSGSTITASGPPGQLTLDYSGIGQWFPNFVRARVTSPQPLPAGTYTVSANLSAAAHPPNGCSATANFDVSSNGIVDPHPLTFTAIVPSPAVLGQEATIVCAFPGFRFDRSNHAPLRLLDSNGQTVRELTIVSWSDMQIKVRMPTRAEYQGYSPQRQGHLIQFGNDTQHRLAFDLIEVVVPTPVGVKGDFRISVTGFKAVQETWDAPNPFAMGDEVIAYVRTGSMDLPSGANASVTFASHDVIWYVQTGEEESADTGSPGWPVTAWEGELQSGRNGVVVCPFLFEQDVGNADNLRVPDWNTALVAGGLPELVAKTNEVRRALLGGLDPLPEPLTSLDPSKTLDTIERVQTTSPVILFTFSGSGHRPIGSQPTPDNPDRRFVHPWLIVLTYELAELLARRPDLASKIALPYTDAPDVGGGHYEMYLKVERV